MDSRKSTRRTATLAAGLLAAWSLAACSGTPADTPASSGPDDPAMSTSTGSQGSQSAAAPPSEEPTAPVETPTEAPSQPAAEAWPSDPVTHPAGAMVPDIVVTDVRMGTHEGYDRVVLEFSGAMDPGWRTDWTSQPTQQGSGRAIDLAGPQYLDVTVTGATMPITDGLQQVYYSGAKVQQAGNLSAYFDGTFEDQTHVVIGMDATRGYTVSTLTDPMRVVIDVQR